MGNRAERKDGNGDCTVGKKTRGPDRSAMLATTATCSGQDLTTVSVALRIDLVSVRDAIRLAERNDLLIDHVAECSVSETRGDKVMARVVDSARDNVAVPPPLKHFPGSKMD